MIRPIVTSPLMLRAPGEDADPTDALDAQVGQDLLDTLEAHRHERTRSFSGYMAQIIQHEVDHTNGILI